MSSSLCAWAGSRRPPGRPARLKALRKARDAIADGSETGVPAQRAIEWLGVLAKAVQQADLPKEWAAVLHAIYERIRGNGSEKTAAHLLAAPTIPP
jgi:truncated hemoglobin YjbI